MRVIAPDIGGSFGIKGSGYPEAVVVAFLARRLHQPIKWIEDRRENLLACAHAHEQKVQVTAGAARWDDSCWSAPPCGSIKAPTPLDQSLLGSSR